MVDFGQDKKTSHGRGAQLSFDDIVGQEELKRALLAVTANDDLDGLLIRGEKGTAKSTAVRALTDFLPDQTVVADCPYGCPLDDPAVQCDDCRERSDPPTEERPVPLVTLPLGATRERVVGTLSVADALAGDYEFDPGLLARANRGILYVDEVNLLDDHLVDVLLDAAAGGVNRVERDGVSVSHPAEFTLVGTMNPEEGDLRPQLRDRFALQATVTACDDIDQRVTIIDRAIDRGVSDTPSRAENGRMTTAEFRTTLQRARELLPDVELPPDFAAEIAELCRDSGAEGHRGDIATARAAMTFAALDGRPNVIEADVRQAAALALPHRLQSRPFEDTPDTDDLLDDHFDDEGGGDEEEEREQSDGGEGEDTDETATDDSTDAEETDDGDPSDDAGGDDTEGDGSDGENDGSSGRGGDADDGAEGDTEPAPQQGADDSGDDQRDGGDDGDGNDGGQGDQQEGTPLVPGGMRADIGEAQAPELSAPEAVDAERAGGGSRSRTTPHVDNEGPRVRTQRAESNRRIDAAASVRAATSRGASSVASRDLRQSVRQSSGSALVLFVVDASASMLPAMRAAKGTVLELLKDAYQQRDEVAFVAFAGDDAEVLLPPTDSVTLAARHLKDLPTGDRTPLPAGLRTAREVIDRADPAASVVVVVTDGRANVAAESPVRETREAARAVADSGARVVVVDAGDDDHSGLTGLIAEETDGARVPLSSLTADRIDTVVDAVRESQV